MICFSHNQIQNIETLGTYEKLSATKEPKLGIYRGKTLVICSKKNNSCVERIKQIFTDIANLLLRIFGCLTTNPAKVRVFKQKVEADRSKIETKEANDKAVLEKITALTQKVESLTSGAQTEQLTLATTNLNQDPVVLAQIAALKNIFEEKIPGFLNKIQNLAALEVGFQTIYHQFQSLLANDQIQQQILIDNFKLLKKYVDDLNKKPTELAANTNKEQASSQKMNEILKSLEDIRHQMAVNIFKGSPRRTDSPFSPPPAPVFLKPTATPKAKTISVEDREKKSGNFQTAQTPSLTEIMRNSPLAAYEESEKTTRGHHRSASVSETPSRPRLVRQNSNLDPNEVKQVRKRRQSISPDSPPHL